ncbi:methyltransferase-like protein 21C-like [Hibiscus syriacus]|uniref:Methyltransferase-like protein 21C-like n=1 Tax=Hibiscus syriacus TaxID=106335 RepID=A0A6A3A0I0_HIBSY|nr:methyltransferase-like protein 21C-like [Hibiscus syriacus]
MVDSSGECTVAFCGLETPRAQGLEFKFKSVSLNSVLWLHGNHFTGPIPDNIGNLTLLKDLSLNGNSLVGLIPSSLANMRLETLDLNNNQFMGSIPISYGTLEFLDGLNYPSMLVSSWSDNEPCIWVGIACNGGKVSILNLPHYNLSGTLSPSVAKLDSLSQIRLQANNLRGSIPNNWTSLKALETLDFSDNNISGSGSSPTDSSVDSTGTKGFKRNTFGSIVAPVASFAVLAFLVAPLSLYCCKKRQDSKLVPSLVVHPRDLSDSDNVVKVVASNGSTSVLTGSGSARRNSSCIGESRIIEAGNLVISVQVLRNVTKKFASENELGRGGFGVVYKGELDDGTQIAVKRMGAGVITSKALDEFQAEIAVLSKVRHGNLVYRSGYSIEGNERIFVYEYMPQGALSKHLFHWKSLKLEPLSWKRRLNIALDVARGMEYLHILAHQSFIHRDLKSSNILLGDDFREKVSDFGLIKLAPDGKKSVVTRLAGTFGYLAPEYAVTGKITTKADARRDQYLAAWFCHIKSDKEKLRAAIDPCLDIKDETFKSISIIAELAGHCIAREPSQRPDMGHAVNVLAPLLDKWKPWDDDNDEYCGTDYSLPLNQTVKGRS